MTGPPRPAVDPRTTRRGGLVLSRRASAFLVAVAGWSWVIWPTFLRNIAHDPRSFRDGTPTGFFLVHLVLTVVSLVVGTAVGVLGGRGLWAARRAGGAGTVDSPTGNVPSSVDTP